MEKKLKNLKVAFLVADGFEQVELTEPKKALDQEGAQTYIVSPMEGKVKAWQKTDWGDEYIVDIQLEKAAYTDFDALVLPGGQINPDILRTYGKAVKFVQGFFNSGKPVAAICHGPWLLIEAKVLEGRNLTSYHSIKTDILNAGGNWVDQEVVVDGGLITSRNPGDIPVFNKKIIEEFALALTEK
ncbi:MAG: type 1 glutamine amidotransferase domain-containing protein [Candidatus Cyclobacteriaceae bacterium M3_2C_046]